MYYLWYNERMKYPKIDLKTVRLQARQFQAENPRLFLVYLLPSILVILSGFLNPLERINESVLEQPFLNVFGHVSQAYLFPLLVSFIGAMLLTSSVYTTLKLIKNPDTEHLRFPMTSLILVPDLALSNTPYI